MDIYKLTTAIFGAVEKVVNRLGIDNRISQVLAASILSEFLLAEAGTLKQENVGPAPLSFSRVIELNQAAREARGEEEPPVKKRKTRPSQAGGTRASFASEGDEVELVKLWNGIPKSTRGVVMGTSSKGILVRFRQPQSSDTQETREALSKGERLVPVSQLMKAGHSMPPMGSWVSKFRQADGDLPWNARAVIVGQFKVKDGEEWAYLVRRGEVFSAPMYSIRQIVIPGAEWSKEQVAEVQPLLKGYKHE